MRCPVTLEEGETWAALTAWFVESRCVHCGSKPEGHGWVLQGDTVVAFVCPNGTRHDP